MDLRHDTTKVYDIVIVEEDDTGKFRLVKLCEIDKRNTNCKISETLMDTTVIGNERLAIEAQVYIDKLEKSGCAVKKLV